MFEHAGQGYAGHGTLCGALGVASCLINLVIYDKNFSYAPVVRPVDVVVRANAFSDGALR